MISSYSKFLVWAYFSNLAFFAEAIVNLIMIGIRNPNFLECAYFLSMFRFLLFKGFIDLFLHHNIYLLLGIPFFSKCSPFFYFDCLTSSFSVVHLSVVCLHVPWYWQNFLPLDSSYESSSSKSLKVIAFHFLNPFLLVFLFLERTLGGIDFSKFSILVSKNSVIE